jgi:hypothetical protein
MHENAHDEEAASDQKGAAIFAPTWLKPPDLSLVLLAVVGVTMVFMVTFELWLSH